MAVRNNWVASIVATVALGSAIAGTALAFAPPRTTLDGVYTKEQADRGYNAYTRSCARCHQQDLNGTGGAPALHTSTFIENWREGYLSNLFHHRQVWMPPQNLKGTLKESEYLDIVAYFLAFNEYPAGAKELAAADLNTILFVGPDGAQPLPDSATVRAVGCLTHRGDEWSLTHVGETPRVHDGSETYEAELGWSRQAPLGASSFRLPNIEDDHKQADLMILIGKKVQVKGVVGGSGVNRRINAFSVEALDLTSACQ